MENRFRLDLYIYKVVVSKNPRKMCLFSCTRSSVLTLWLVYCSFAHEFAIFFLQERVFRFPDSSKSSLCMIQSVWLNMVKHTWQITWRRAPCHVYVSPEFKGRRSEINNLDFIRVPAWHANSGELHFSDILARTTLFLATCNWRNLMSRLVLFLDGTFCGRDKI